MQHLNKALEIDEENVEALVARGALWVSHKIPRLCLYPTSFSSDFFLCLLNFLHPYPLHLSVCFHNVPLSIPLRLNLVSLSFCFLLSVDRQKIPYSLSLPFLSSSLLLSMLHPSSLPSLSLHLWPEELFMLLRFILVLFIFIFIFIMHPPTISTQPSPSLSSLKIIHHYINILSYLELWKLIFCWNQQKQLDISCKTCE